MAFVHKEARNWDTGVTVKAVASGRTAKVAGWLVRFGGPSVTDLDREWFDESTDFGGPVVDRPMPVYFCHANIKHDGLKGLDDRVGVGRVTKRPGGVWIEADLDLSRPFVPGLAHAASKGLLGWSSGSVKHLVRYGERNASGVRRIERWPLGEASITPDHCEPRATAHAAGPVPALDDLAREDRLFLRWLTARRVEYEGMLLKSGQLPVTVPASEIAAALGKSVSVDLDAVRAEAEAWHAQYQRQLDGEIARFDADLQLELARDREQRERARAARARRAAQLARDDRARRGAFTPADW